MVILPITARRPHSAEQSIFAIKKERCGRNVVLKFRFTVHAVLKNHLGVVRAEIVRQLDIFYWRKLSLSIGSLNFISIDQSKKCVPAI